MRRNILNQEYEREDVFSLMMTTLNLNKYSPGEKVEIYKNQIIKIERTE